MASGSVGDASPLVDRSALARTWGRPPGFIGWIAQVNHKAVGLRYIVTGLVFFVLAGIDGLRIRLQLAVPESTLMGPDAYDAAFTMHGTTMMFLFAVPVLEGIGIYLIPLMIGARDMALPRLNAFGYWIYLFAGVGLWTAYLLGVPPSSGWFAYPPLTLSEYEVTAGMDVWATMITLLEVAALVAAVELIITVLKQRAPGMTLARMPVFVWAMLVTSFMVIFAMPPLMIASLMLELDRSVGMQFFNPLALGEPLLWQHLFWWFGHPDVYIIQLPAFGIVTSVVIASARRPIVGYTAIVLATFAIGFLSFGLWVHHMYATGLPLLGMSFFAAASMMVAIPSGVQVFCWIATIWNGRIVVSTAFLFVVGTILTFVMGGVTGVMLASVPFDLQVHDTFFVVAHFHYVLFGSLIFPLFAGFYHWFPKLTGRLLSERLGRWNFGLMFAGTHLTFFPQHQLGFEGMPRRVFTYLPELGWGGLNLLSTIGSVVLAAGVLVFLANLAFAAVVRVDSGDDPWNAPSLEWSIPSPPPAYNFVRIPAVRGRYPRWEPATTEKESWLLLSDLRRETPITSPLDAVPQGKWVLPGPTLLPLWTALALFGTFAGFVLHPAVGPVGLIVTAYLVARWAWPHEPGEPTEGPSSGSQRTVGSGATGGES